MARTDTAKRIREGGNPFMGMTMAQMKKKWSSMSPQQRAANVKNFRDAAAKAPKPQAAKPQAPSTKPSGVFQRMYKPGKMVGSDVYPAGYKPGKMVGSDPKPARSGKGRRYSSGTRNEMMKKKVTGRNRFQRRGGR